MAETDRLVVIRDYYPGVIGEITRAHAVYYHEYWGFDITFETQVGRELSEFMARFNPETDFLKAVLVDGQFAGAIAIDGALAKTDGARLRWFIVEPQFQGLGIGKRLTREAMEFCARAGHERAFLWTFAGLDAARSLYEGAGFKLAVEEKVEQWGDVIMEQKFEFVGGEKSK